jgi:eukaryotic-like serine/threonine-protein kinase
MTSSPDLLRRAEAVYHVLADLPPSERDAAAVRECGGDADLLREVRSLLAVALEADGFLDQPALGAGFRLTPPPRDDEPDPLIGATLGPYTITRRLASGGMGTVYDALRSDEHMTQRAAIKVVKRGMDSEDILRRFRAERQTLAGLLHPNIARLLDAGITPDGRPYLAMEFVEGVPIDEYCQTHDLDTSARLALFRACCEAVRAAHQGLVIHRDLKPSNILVAADGTPKLLDFGIAKVLSPSRADAITTDAERRLTPEYASPEQIRGLPITTASDVYSLGVILYELLTGRRPYAFDTRSMAEIERVVCESDPPAPSQAVTRTPPAPTTTRDASPQRLSRRLRGDLDTIVLAAMHKDPRRRYSSVEALIDDLDRYAANLPVRAHKDTLGYRTAKFVRRNPVGTVLGALSILFLAGGGAGISCNARQAARERDTAYTARDQSEAVIDFLTGMFSSADPDDLGPDATLREALDRARVTLDSEYSNRPMVRAAVQSAVGRAYASLGEFEIADDLISTAFTARLQLTDPQHHDVAESHLDLGELRFRQGRYEDAQREFAKGLAIHREAAQEARRPADNPNIDRALNMHGTALRALGRLDEALADHQEALRIRRARAQGRPTLDVAESLNNIGAVYWARRDFDEGIGFIREAADARAAILPQDHPLLLQSRMNLATMLGSQGKLEEAEPLFIQAADAARKAYPSGHPSLAVYLHSLGTCEFRLGKLQEAQAAYREALAIRAARLDPADPALASTQASLGRVLLRLEQFDEGERLIADAVRRVRPEQGPIDRRLHDAVRDLIKRLESTGRADQAAPLADLLPKG